MQEIDRFQHLAYDPRNHEESRRRFGQAIQALRKSRGVSLKAISKNIGINSSYLSRVENGLVPPSGKLVEQLADTLNASRFDLAVQGGLLAIDWGRITEQQLEELKQIVDGGSFSLQD